MGTRRILLALLPALALAVPAAAKVPLRYTAGDVFQLMLEAQDRRAWMQAQVIKTEVTKGSKKEPTRTHGRLTSTRRPPRVTSPGP